MKKIENLVGKKFNDITVISLNDKKDNTGRVLWNCVCVCGKKLLVRTDNLKHTIKSCGCKSNRRENAVLNQKYAMYRRDILKKGMNFNLTKEEFNSIIQKNCYYCNSEPTLWSQYIDNEGKVYDRYKDKMNNDYMLKTRIKINGIDRLDSKKGYSVENCVPCCKQCNIMKNIYSEKDFLLQVKKIYEFNLVI